MTRDQPLLLIVGALKVGAWAFIKHQMCCYNSLDGENLTASTSLTWRDTFAFA